MSAITNTHIHALKRTTFFQNSFYILTLLWVLWNIFSINALTNIQTEFNDPELIIGSALFVISIFSWHLATKQINNIQQISAPPESTSKEMLKFKTNFVANFAYELRAPLYDMISASQLISSNDSIKRKEGAETVSRTSSKLFSTLNELADIANLQAGRLQLEDSDFDLRTLLTETIRIAKEEPQYKNQPINLQYSSTLPHYYRGDAGRLQQIIFALVENGIKHSPESSIKIIVNPQGMSLDKQILKIEVIDKGQGIPIRDQDKIFDTFEDIYTFSKNAHRKLGTTLNLCKKLSELMEGNIEYKPNNFGGSTFCVTTKLYLTSKKNIENINHAVEIGRDNRIKIPKILVVEDNPFNLIMTSKLLEQINCQVYLAGNGREAIKHYETKQIDLIFMDCIMPIIDGYEATKIIRTMESNSQNKIPIIALTGKREKNHRDKCLKTGMDDYLSKPIHQDQLQSSLSKWLA